MIGAWILIVTLAACCALIVRADSGKDDWIEYIEQICEKKDLCPELVEAIIERESNWDPWAVNGDCVGLMQIDQLVHWRRAQQLGAENLIDPYDNIRVGISILEDLFEKYEDPAAVLMFYHAGYSDRMGIGAYQNGVISSYASEVLDRADELEREHGK